jgi:hypothetical protein
MRSVLGLLLFILLYGNTAVAGTFCLAGQAISPQCIYDDVESCSRASNPPSTSCIINSDSYFTFTGNSTYCVVSSSAVAQCLYVDRGQCNDEAAKSKGICVDKINISESSDPYRFDPRVQR